jgi:hypothetical protein
MFCLKVVVESNPLASNMRHPALLARLLLIPPIVFIIKLVVSILKFFTLPTCPKEHEIPIALPLDSSSSPAATYGVEK